MPGFPNQSKALICVPLKDGEIPLGVLNLSGNIGEVKFEQTDYEYVETIARQLVTTVKNIRMRETIEEHNRTLEQKVLERTAELRQKNQDIQAMMQNMQQQGAAATGTAMQGCPMMQQMQQQMHQGGGMQGMGHGMMNMQQGGGMNMQGGSACANICGQMSVTSMRFGPPGRRSNRTGMSPVPEATSSATSPPSAAMRVAIRAFQRRCAKRLKMSQSRS